MGGCFCGCFPPQGLQGALHLSQDFTYSLPPGLAPELAMQSLGRPRDAPSSLWSAGCPGTQWGPGSLPIWVRARGDRRCLCFPFLIHGQARPGHLVSPDTEAGGFTGLFKMCCSHPFLHRRKNAWQGRGKINCPLDCLLVLLFQRKKHTCKHGKGIEQVLSF